jgi:hypothetical protein
MSRLRWVTPIVLLAFLHAGAGTAPGQEPEPPGDPVEESGCVRLVDYDPEAFGPDSHVVDHGYLPLQPGTQRVFEGRSNATGAVLPHRVTFTVTGLTKVVDGVRGAVVWDVDESDGRLAETELAVFAQDPDRHVWNLGEYPEEYPGGVFAGAPNTWFAGLADAEPGIHMPHVPPSGMPEYLQGSVPSLEFLDCATIVDTNASVCVPAGCFDRVHVIHERSPLDPDGGIQVKYHARGVGIVQIGALNDPEDETLVLTEFNRLNASELAAANREARILDQRGHQCHELYALTAPLEGPDDGDYGPYACPAPPPPPLVDNAPAGFTNPWAAPSPPAAPAPSGPPTARPGTNAGRGRYAARVDHPLFPLRYGRTLLYEGGKDRIKVRVRRRVRREPVRVAGVRTTAVDVRQWEDGVLVARTTGYYAQDRAGNVWQLGERIDAVEDGKVIGLDRQWIAGRKGARRSLVMPAEPRRGQRFRSAQAPGAAPLRSTVVAVDAKVTTPGGRFTGCLKRRDRRQGRGSHAEVRVFCANVGLVREELSSGVVALVRIGKGA